jgi:cyanophycin synthetase
MSAATTGTRVTRGALGTMALVHKGLRRLHGRDAAAVAVAAERSRFYEDAWRQAAEAVGGDVTVLSGPLLRIGYGSGRLLVRENVTSLDDPVTLTIAGDKPLVYELLTAEGIPVPEHAVVSHDDLAGAEAFIRRAGAPCVAKPALDGAGGAGVTTGLCDRHRLAAALARAGAWSDDVLLERQVGGGSYRLLYLDGELLDAVLRRPPTLRGDGRSTIRALVAAENAERTARGAEVAQTLLHVDRDARATLRLQGYGLESVPPAGAVVQVKTVVNDNRWDENEAATDRVCPEIVQVGAAAAEAVGARLAGVDILTVDPGVPIERSDGVVLEVNTTPGYYYHYRRKGGAAPVATMILERLTGARP